jgi:putative endonuclease
VIKFDKYFVYILRSCISGKFYIGQTNNLCKRLEQHNSGYSKSTKSEIPWELVYKEVYNNRSEAMKRERQLKSFKSKSYLNEIIVSGERPDNNREGQRFDPA